MGSIKSKLKSFFINASIFFAACLIAILIAEPILRATAKKENHVEHEVLGATGVPGQGYDDNGFRNEYIPDQVDVVAIGDSQTVGNNAGKNESWPDVFSELSGFSVYQMAFGGYGPLEYRYLFDEAQQYKPEMILVAFYLGNDTRDAYGSAYGKNRWASYRSEGRSLDELYANDSDIRLQLQSGYEEGSLKLKILKWRRWLRRNSAVYTLIGDGTRIMREKLGIAEKKEDKDERVEEWAEGSDIAYAFKADKLTTLLSPVYRYDVVDLEDPVVKEGFRITKQVIQEMKEFADENGQRFAVPVIPTKEHVYVQYAEAEGQNIDGDLLRYDGAEKNIIEQFMSFCNEIELACLDVTSSLVAKLQEQTQIYPREMDGHPIPAGYAAIAESILIQLTTSDAEELDS